jgi:LysM repeat protein
MKVIQNTDELFKISKEMTELRRLKIRDPSPQSNLNDKDILTFIDLPIEKTDTLQGLSLKYGCTVSQIKRLNNLAVDRDLYALSKCKIPIKEYSVQSTLYEKDLQRVHINDLFWLNNKKLVDNDLQTEVYATSDSDETAHTTTVVVDDDDDKKPLLEDNIPTSKNGKVQKREALLFFKNIDKDLETIRASTNQQKIMLETTVLNDGSDMLEHAQNIQPDSSLCNCKEVTIIGFIVLIVIPLVIFVYMRILNKIV